MLQRSQALTEKEHAGTLLLSPLEVQAEARGFNALAVALRVLGEYQGLVAGVRQAWAEANRESLIGFVRAYAKAVDWLYDTANKDDALAIFTKYLPNVSREGAEAAYRVLLDPKEGFERHAAIDMQGVKRVLELRAKWAEPKGAR